MNKNQKLELPRLLLIAFLSLLTIISCKKDDLSDPCADEDLGEFRLLCNATNSIPYKENTKLFFQDSIGNQVEFDFDYGNGGYRTAEYYITTPCEFNNTKEKRYKINQDYYWYDINETSPSLNLKFFLSLRVDPYQEFDEMEVSDQLEINRRNKADTNSMTVEIGILVNSRELTEEDINKFPKPIDNISLLGRTFHKVYSNLDSSFYYNYEKGIIAFTDWDEKLWVLEKTEKKK